MIYAFLIAVAAGGTSSGILAALWQGAKGSVIKARADLAQATAATAAATKAVEISEAARGDERARLNNLIVELKKEVAALEVNMPRDPAGVRSRINELLGAVQPPVPVPAPGAGTGPLGIMPFGSAPKT